MEVGQLKHLNNPLLQIQLMRLKTQGNSRSHLNNALAYCSCVCRYTTQKDIKCTNTLIGQTIVPSVNAHPSIETSFEVET